MSGHKVRLTVIYEFELNEEYGKERGVLNQLCEDAATGDMVQDIAELSDQGTKTLVVECGGATFGPYTVNLGLYED